VLYERIKEICRSKKISVRRIETDLHFSYGSIGKWNKNTPSIERVKMVANYLGVDIGELINDSLESNRS